MFFLPQIIGEFYFLSKLPADLSLPEYYNAGFYVILWFVAIMCGSLGLYVVLKSLK